MATSEVPDFAGYWKLKKNDANFGKYLQAMGVNFVLRKVISNATVYQDIEQTDNAFKIKVILPVATQELSFTVGEAFDFYHNFKKVTLKRTATWEGSSLVIKSATDAADDDGVERREIEDGILVLTLTKGDVITKRYFEKTVKK